MAQAAEILERQLESEFISIDYNKPPSVNFPCTMSREDAAERMEAYHVRFSKIEMPVLLDL